MSNPSNTEPFEILIIDDHAMFRTGLRMVLEMELEFTQIFESDSLMQSYEQGFYPDLILLDIQLPGINGLDGMTLLQKRWPQSAIIVLSALNESEKVNLAYAQGAEAFVSKTASSTEIVTLVKRVQQGQVLDKPDFDVVAPINESTVKLTPRQCEVLELLSQGAPNKVIARKLGVSENTIRWHVQSLLALLEVSSRSEAAFKARSIGLIGR